MDANEGLFSPAALAVLDSQQYDPHAKGSYELMSGGLVWPDEFPDTGSAEWRLIARNYLYRYLIAYRSDITLGEERVGFRPVWEQALREAPNWPGLRPERRGEAARKRLLAAKRRETRCFDAIERQMEEQRTNETA